MHMNDREQLQHEISSAKEQIAIAEALERLRNNRDFKKVILQHFVKDEVVRMASLSADLSLSKDQREDTAALVSHHGYLPNWFRIQELKAGAAQRTLEEASADLDALEGNDFAEGEGPYLREED